MRRHTMPYPKPVNEKLINIIISQPKFALNKTVLYYYGIYMHAIFSVPMDLYTIIVHALTEH